jgi:hypothetical protein
MVEERHSDVWHMLFFRLKEHTVSQAQHRCTIPDVALPTSGAAVPAFLALE